ncbi:glycoside hydrolase family 2 TIM barrel-domain containing protein [Neolewinella lacunae]|uniref:DUF4982 domain-containing protein n=1 Tax=Neolewinella lacunae TaxID=1517758 RepID=A0A923T8F6_9BACT|nr:glycoside hydrolase family 2 TIM barrel-domain containing protein [Neolewinella lacunae]MBC6994524.1 DUF4982 domain-containing protein [Neolewinella lacunae]MDN3634217.1 glycoside hydrolase family 2 TIM barrel-domain containing protein [Neolewinella lacunae]
MRVAIFPVLSLLLSAFLCTCVSARSAPETAPPQVREQRKINDGWTYFEHSTPNLAALPAVGTPVTLPHTWNQWDAVDNTPGYRRDASWYLRPLAIKAVPGQRYALYFEGANTKAEVYLNGQRIGGHVGGYVGFTIDLTPHLAASGANQLAVRVDNGYDPDLIPSQKSDFFIYGGLTRDVWLQTTPAVHLERLEISTPAVSNSSATTRIVAYLGQAAAPGQHLAAELYDPTSNERVAGAEIPLPAGANRAEIQLPPLANPRLWSPATPNRYAVRVRLLNGEATMDELRDWVGYRWFSFEPNGPFYLNGERLLLRGTHRHEEHAGYGAAMPDSLHLADVQQMKDLGVNFVRLGHYPQDPAVYRACDSLGLIVWDELPWCRGGKGGSTWEANTKQLLAEQIRQNFNHPSIFFWSLGNELYWLPDFPGGDDPAQLNAFLGELNDLAHALDPGRLTALRKYYEGADIPDVFSPSIWSGWYAGVYKNYGPTLEKQRDLYPRFLHMEYGGSSHIGRHTETPITGDGTVKADEWAEDINQANVVNVAKSGDWSENYVVDLFDWHLSVSETTDWFAGNAQWAFKDFGTPLRPENAIPYLNQKGLVDRAGKPKDAYYVFKSYWSGEPFTYLESHTWTERSGPVGKTREQAVFSNCAEVELWLNGVSMGRKQRRRGVYPAQGLTWELNFAAGANQLISLGYEGGQLVAADTLALTYAYEKAGSPEEIVLTQRTLPNGHLLIEATMQDAAGRRVLDYEDHVYFSLDGSGKLLVDYGTPTRSQVIEMANGRAAIELVPGTGRAVIEVRNQDFKGSYLVVEMGVR